MSFVNLIEDLETRLNKLKDHEFVSEGSYLIEGIVDELNEMSSNMRTAYGEYFNEYGLTTPEMGEGMHFMTGNGYSSSIPLSFEYFKVRDLMLDNLGKFTGDETLYIKNIRTKLDNFENVTLPEWEEMYEEYNRNPPIPAAGSGGSSESEGESSGEQTDPIPSPKDFWKRYGLNEEFSRFITSLGSEVFQCGQKCKALKKEIHNWFDLGSDVSMTIAVAQHVNGLPSQVYDKICGENKENVGVYSQKMKRALNTTDKIKERYPDSNVAKQCLCLRDVVCNQMNVKEKSAVIYNAILQIFEDFGINPRRSER